MTSRFDIGNSARARGDVSRLLLSNASEDCLVSWVWWELAPEAIDHPGKANV